MSGKRFETAEDLINKGNSFYVDEQFDEALEAYTAALDLESDNVEAYLKRSAAHYSLKNYAGTNGLSIQISDIRTASSNTNHQICTAPSYRYFSMNYTSDTLISLTFIKNLLPMQQRLSLWSQLVLMPTLERGTV